MTSSPAPDLEPRTEAGRLLLEDDDTTVLTHEAEAAASAAGIDVDTDEPRGPMRDRDITWEERVAEAERLHPSPTSTERQGWAEQHLADATSGSPMTDRQPAMGEPRTEAGRRLLRNIQPLNLSDDPHSTWLEHDIAAIEAEAAARLTAYQEAWLDEHVALDAARTAESGRLREALADWRRQYLAYADEADLHRGISRDVGRGFRARAEVVDRVLALLATPPAPSDHGAELDVEHRIGPRSQSTDAPLAPHRRGTSQGPGRMSEPRLVARFLHWWVTWAVVGALLAALVYVALHRTDGRTSYEAVRAPQTALGPRTAPEWAWTPLDGSGRLSEALATRPTSEEEAGVPSAPVADSPLPPGPNPEPFGLGNRTAHRAGSALEPPLASARPTSCESPCSVDVSSWDIPTPEPVSVNGIASHMGRGFPSWYLALPQGPGFIARICGPGGCVTRTSTDSGPSKAMQRWPFYRVADLSVADFETVCGCSASLGLVPVSVAIVGRSG